MKTRIVLEVEAGLAADEVEHLQRLFNDAFGEFVSSRSGRGAAPDTLGSALAYVKHRYCLMSIAEQNHKVNEVFLYKTIASKLQLAASSIHTEVAEPTPVLTLGRGEVEVLYRALQLGARAGSEDVIDLLLQTVGGSLDDDGLIALIEKLDRATAAEALPRARSSEPTHVEIAVEATTVDTAEDGVVVDTDEDEAIVVTDEDDVEDAIDEDEADEDVSNGHSSAPVWIRRPGEAVVRPLTPIIQRPKQPSPKRPGQILRDEFLKPRKMTVDELAQAIQVEARTLYEMVQGQRRINRIAPLLAAHFGTTPEYWIELQAAFDAGRPYQRPTYEYNRTRERALQDPELRNQALELVDGGLTSEAAGDQLAVKKMTVAGWRSARTKGCYDDEK